MDVQVLRSFAEVGSHLSVTQAAMSLGYTQSAVSQHVQRMERVLGGRLIERSGRGVVLTELGDRALPLARVIVVRGRAVEAQAV
ncbi:LysR family transcriptional regulator [Intrasporangium sp.]|uniref:LysR family transcriptional regulator n=1 Tax=Intrasporangium sp. TaxID=1925024 RepID=UPI003221F5D5